MITTPIIPESYQRMAWDLVGKMPRTKTGFSYILTVMCLGSRFPYAIPLQRVNAQSLAEGLMEVISHTSIPIELLSNQGSIFLSTVLRKIDKGQNQWDKLLKYCLLAYRAIPQIGYRLLPI